MAEYIEREALMAQLEERREFLFKANGPYDHYTSGFDEAYDRVEEFPSADVLEVVHGRWEKASDGDGVICSCCGEDFCTIIHETDRFKHCPNCGARMDGE